MKFDDDTNATVRDSSGNNNHGFLKNSSHALVTTQHKTDTPYGTGKAADLNGNHYIVVSTPGEDTFDGGNQFTIAFWTKEFPDNGWEPSFQNGRKWTRLANASCYSGEKRLLLP